MLFKWPVWAHIYVCIFKVEEADHIYLLMKEEYRISRNVRLAWFLGKLNQVIWPASKPELVSVKHDSTHLLLIFIVLNQTRCFKDLKSKPGVTTAAGKKLPWNNEQPNDQRGLHTFWILTATLLWRTFILFVFYQYTVFSSYWWINSLNSQPFTCSWTLRTSWICSASSLKDGSQTSPPPCTRTHSCLPLERPSWPGGTASSSS